MIYIIETKKYTNTEMIISNKQPVPRNNVIVLNLNDTNLLHETTVRFSVTFPQGKSSKSINLVGILDQTEGYIGVGNTAKPVFTQSGSTRPSSHTVTVMLCWYFRPRLWQMLVFGIH